MKKQPPKIVALASGSTDKAVSILSAAGFSVTAVALTKPDVKPSDRSGFSDFIGELLTGGIDTVLLMTALGTKSIVETASATVDNERFLNALQDCQLVSGSSATTRVLEGLGLNPNLKSPSLPDWRKTLLWLESTLDLSHKRIAIESTMQDSGLVAGLESRGVRVKQIHLRTEFQVSGDDLTETLSTGETLPMAVSYTHLTLPTKRIV